jgi:hypothetical protein
MILPSADNLMARLPKENIDDDQRLEQLKSNLRLAHKLAAHASRKSHQNNKRWYNRKAKPGEFEVQDVVYLYHSTRKPGMSKKFAKTWSGPWQITKIFELNYEIVGRKGKRQVLHVNRLKKAYNLELWKPNGSKESRKNAPKRVTRSRHDKRDSRADFKIGPY